MLKQDGTFSFKGMPNKGTWKLIGRTLTITTLRSARAVLNFSDDGKQFQATTFLSKPLKGKRLAPREK